MGSVGGRSELNSEGRAQCSWLDSLEALWGGQRRPGHHRERETARVLESPPERPWFPPPAAPGPASSSVHPDWLWHEEDVGGREQGPDWGPRDPERKPRLPQLSPLAQANLCASGAADPAGLRAEGAAPRLASAGPNQSAPGRAPALNFRGLSLLVTLEVAPGVQI